MMDKSDFYEPDRLFLPTGELRDLALRIGTPFYIFDERTLRRRAQEVFAAFSFAEDFHDYFPVRLCPIPEVLTILHDEGIRVRCESREELALAVRCGFSGAEIRYAALVLTEDLAEALCRLEVSLQLSSPLCIPQVVPKNLSLACFRAEDNRYSLNGAKMRRAKLGFAAEEVEAYLPAFEKAGAERIGLQFSSDGSSGNDDYLAEKFKALLEFAAPLREKKGICVNDFDLGDGFAIQYHRNLDAVPLGQAAALVREQLACAQEGTKISATLGKWLCEPCGWFVSTVLGSLERCRPVIYVGADVSQTIEMRRARYRHISVAGKETIMGRKMCDVAGSRADSGCWFATRRTLPMAEAGDLMVFHDVGTEIPRGCGVPICLRRMDGSIELLEHGEE